MKQTSFRKSLLAAAFLTASATVSASILIPTQFVGNAGNPADTTGFGSVDYDFYIGTFEVTNAQYTEFLNSAASAGDAHGLYNSLMGEATGGIERSGTDGAWVFSTKTGWEDRPVNYVSFLDAARFSNWLTSGDTETGVYDFSDSVLSRDSSAWANGGVAIASENEWYKAAYYDPRQAAYWLYPTSSNTPPVATTPNNTDANSGNFDNAVNEPTPVGSYTLATSPFATYDQAGNVWEWTEGLYENDESLRIYRGGSFGDDQANELISSTRFPIDENFENPAIGFRVTSLRAIPEASTLALIGAGMGFLLLLILVRRKG